MLELLFQVFRKHPVLNLIDRSAALVGERFQASPYQQSASDVIALDTGFTALTSFNASQLLEFAVKLRLASSGCRTHLAQH